MTDGYFDTTYVDKTIIDFNDSSIEPPDPIDFLKGTFKKIKHELENPKPYEQETRVVFMFYEYRTVIDALAPRLYARWYNMSHPNKKTSWRRLNRKQKAQAEDMFWRGKYPFDHLRALYLPLPVRISLDEKYRETA